MPTSPDDIFAEIETPEALDAAYAVARDRILPPEVPHALEFEGSQVFCKCGWSAQNTGLIGFDHLTNPEE
jgi:hypothetical protein